MGFHTSATTLVAVDVEGNLEALGFLGLVGVGAVEEVDLEPVVENEHIALVQARLVQRHLVDTDGALALDVEQAVRPDVTFHLAETRLNSSRKIFNSTRTLEIGKEQLGLVSLNLTVLNWSTAKTLVQFAGFVSGNTRLILRSFLSEPKVDCPCQRTSIASGCHQQDIGISSVKFTIDLAKE